MIADHATAVINIFEYLRHVPHHAIMTIKTIDGRRTVSKRGEISVIDNSFLKVGDAIFIPLTAVIGIIMGDQ